MVHERWMHQGFLIFFPKYAMEEMFYGKYDVFEKESYPQYSCYDHLNKITSASRIDIY